MVKNNDAAKYINVRDKKYFDQHVFVCMNQRPEGHPEGCCLSKGSETILNTLKQKLRNIKTDKKIRINKSGCLGRCSEGVAVVVYPDMQWFLNVQEHDIDDIIKCLEFK
ncbi:MAG TPA: (2Fe-2S) ferredoxin domain-containing protein [Oligoflexia bacterium]|nr:(2Fe-2S) ferredoxin domain-containing protein [Oligoflexia bacterium]HMR23786.1 (2Fe-2S) ferredoxin domain-containing protein [Oligoflexia bacterium]